MEQEGELFHYQLPFESDRYHHQLDNSMPKRCQLKSIFQKVTVVRNHQVSRKIQIHQGQLTLISVW